MLWLPIVLVVGTVVCVYGLYFHFVFIKKADPGISFFMLTACMVYGFAVSAGWFFTYFDSPTIDDWWKMVLLRVGLIATGSVLISISSIVTARANDLLGWKVFAMLGGFWLIAFWCGRASALDLLEGPITLELQRLDVEKTSGGARGGAQIFSTIKARAKDGSERTVPSAGWEATTAEEAIDACQADQNAYIVVLDHMERVIGVRCLGK